MQATTVPHARRTTPSIPSGHEPLRVRERYLRRRSQRRSLGDRGIIAIWVAVTALVGWLFVVGFSLLAR